MEDEGLFLESESEAETAGFFTEDFPFDLSTEFIFASIISNSTGFTKNPLILCHLMPIIISFEIVSV